MHNSKQCSKNVSTIIQLTAVLNSKVNRHEKNMFSKANSLRQLQTYKLNSDQNVLLAKLKLKERMLGIFNTCDKMS